MTQDSIDVAFCRPKDPINSDSRDSIDVRNLHMKDAAIHGEFKVRGWSCVKCGSIYSDNSSGETAARFCCATWRECADCGGKCGKHYVRCDDCNERRKDRAWFDKLFAKWDGEFPVGEWVCDKFYWDEDELLDAIWECSQDSRKDGDSREYSGSMDGGDGITFSDIVAFCESRKICTCAPGKRRVFDVLDFVADDLPDEEYGIGFGIDGKKCDELNDLVNDWIEKNTPKTYFMSGGKIDPVDVAKALGVAAGVAVVDAAGDLAGDVQCDN